jgi:hypothetical protein
MKVGVAHIVLGSAGCQPAFVGSLPTKIMFGKLPNIAGKLPALPEPKNRAIES